MTTTTRVAVYLRHTDRRTLTRRRHRQIHRTARRAGEPRGVTSRTVARHLTERWANRLGVTLTIDLGAIQ